MSTDTYPINAIAARRLLANVQRDIRQQLKKTKDGDPLELMLARAEHVLSVALISSRPDGYPSTTPGNGDGGGNGRFITVPDEHGQPDRIPVTSTEQAVLSERETSDVITTIARQVLAELATVQTSLSALGHALDHFDIIRNKGHAKPRMCHVAAEMGLPDDVMWEPFRLSDLRKTFDEPQQVCQFVYYFHQREGRLPARADMMRQLERAGVRR